MTEELTITAQELEELFGKVHWDKVFKDELTAEIKSQLDYNMSIILNGTPGEVMKVNRKMNFLEKLEAGRYWFWECLLEWIWCMTHPEDTGGDFFCHICSDYVKYEESTYYE